MNNFVTGMWAGWIVIMLGKNNGQKAVGFLVWTVCIVFILINL